MNTPHSESGHEQTEDAIQRAVIKLAHPDWTEEEIEETLMRYKRIQENMNLDMKGEEKNPKTGAKGKNPE